MSLILNEDQMMLGNMIRRYLADNFDNECRSANQSLDWPGRLWSAFAEELGLLGLSFSPDQGGLGGGAVDVMVAVEAMASALAAEPFVSTVIPASILLCRTKSAITEQLIRDIIAGRAIAVPAFTEGGARIGCAISTIAKSCGGESFEISGKKTIVISAPIATHFIVSAMMDQTDNVGLFLVPAASAGVEMTHYRVLDGIPSADVTFDALSVHATSLLVEDAQALIDEVRDAMLAALCAETVGIMRCMLSDTVEYISQRVQFGKKLSDLQVVQHRAAAMHVEVELAASIALMAALEMGAPADRRTKSIAAAKARVSKAGLFVGQNAIQLHGGIGTTGELALGHYFRRLTAIDSIYGASKAHIERYIGTASLAAGV